VKPEGCAPATALAEDLLQMGSAGVHPLFEARWIRRAFERLNHAPWSSKQVVDAHCALRRLSRQRSLVRMRAYLSALPEDTVDLVVFLYFRRLDAFMDQAERTLH
jgi:hypothetical protein